MPQEKFPLADALAVSQASNEIFTGPPATETDRCSVTFRLSRERHRQLKIKSVASNKTMQDVLTEAVEMFIKAPGEPPKF